MEVSYSSRRSGKEDMHRTIEAEPLAYLPAKTETCLSLYPFLSARIVQNGNKLSQIDYGFLHMKN